MAAGKRIGILGVLLACLLLFGCGKASPAAPDRSAAMARWQETAVLYDELAATANENGWGNDDALYAAFAEASEALLTAHAAIEAAATEEALAASCDRLAEVASSLAAYRALVEEPYSSPLLRLYRVTDEAHLLYDELCTAARENGWDYDKETLAAFAADADRIEAAGAMLRGESPATEEELLCITAALRAYLAEGDTRRASYCVRYLPLDSEGYIIDIEP